MELRQAGKVEVQGDVQSAENANITDTYSKLEFSVIIEVQKTLDNTVYCLCCVVCKCLKSDKKLLEFLSPFL
jgi:hypothetical protein